MRNLAHKRNFFASAFLALCSACGQTGLQPAPVVAPTVAHDRPFHGFIAEGSFGHRLELKTEPGSFGRASAILTLGDDAWRVSDRECAAFRELIERFQALPSLKPGPYLLQPGVGPGSPMANRWTGEAWSVRTQLFGPDWSSADADMRVRQGPYVIWLSDVVAAIKSCGPPTPIA